MVFAIALAVAVIPPLFMAASWFDWVYRALVLLVVACPCALVISTPVTIVSGLAAAARKGILIKGGVYLEGGRHLDYLALDKTGTITHASRYRPTPKYWSRGSKAVRKPWLPAWANVRITRFPAPLPSSARSKAWP